MNKHDNVKVILDRIDTLQEKIDMLSLDDDFKFIKNKEEILGSIFDEKTKLNKELIISKHNERDLLDRVQRFEKLVQRAITEREQNIRYLQNRVTVLEQSFPLYVANRLKKGMKHPLSLPKELFNVSKAIGGGVKRKIIKKKRKYTIVKLPFRMSEVPPVTEKFILDRELSVNEKVNELFLLGLYNNPKQLSELRIAGILDEFSFDAFKYDVNLISFKPENWFEVLKTELPHLLLVESAWQGNGGSWQYKIAKYNLDQGTELDDMLEWCRRNNIPTIFWNKEDPIHFERFINTASKFDYIYTSDLNCIEKYKEITGKDNVFSLSFAAQPKIHNPIKVPSYKSNNICFAGSYYANRHEQRRLEQVKMLEAAMPYGLVIYDRNHSNHNVNKHMLYPEKFQMNIQGSLKYKDLVKTYKQFKVFLNVNSVKNSPTMFSRRVYELLACGTSVVSTDSVGINQQFGDVVTQMSSEEDYGEKLKTVMNDEQLRIKNEVKGQRAVFSNHTYAHRLYEIATNSGFNIRKPYSYNILILANVYNNEELDTIKRSFYCQSYELKRLLVVNYMNEDLVNEENISYINVQKFKEFTLEEIINDYYMEFDFIGSFSYKHYYGKYYLTDIVNAFSYSNADAIGKSAYFNIENNVLSEKNVDTQYSYTSSLVNDAFLINLEKLNEFKLTFTDLLEGNYDFQLLNSYGMRFFSVNIYNFVKDNHMNINNENEEINL